jgi:hypothetical protein
LRNCGQLVRPGGIVIFSENFLHGTAQRGAHQVSRSLSEIAAAVNDAKLSVYERRPMFVLMNAPVDTNSRAIQRFWSLLTRVVRRGEATAFIVGMLLYPVELLLCSVLAESPSTELMICIRDAHQKS